MLFELRRPSLLIQIIYFIDNFIFLKSQESHYDISNFYFILSSSLYHVSLHYMCIENSLPIINFLNSRFILHLAECCVWSLSGFRQIHDHLSYITRELRNAEELTAAYRQWRLPERWSSWWSSWCSSRRWCSCRRWCRSSSWRYSTACRWRICGCTCTRRWCNPRGTSSMCSWRDRRVPRVARSCRLPAPAWSPPPGCWWPDRRRAAPGRGAPRRRMWRRRPEPTLRRS